MRMYSITFTIYFIIAFQIVMKNILKDNLSLAAIFIVAVVCIWNAFNFQNWNHNGVMTWDAGVYYAYLPTAFNGRPESFTDAEKRFSGLEAGLNYVISGSHRSIKTSMGMSILYSPFYFTAYLIHLLKYGSQATVMKWNTAK